MKASDLQQKSVDELEQELLKLRRDQLGMRMQKAMGQLGQTHLVRQSRRDVARIKTVLNSKKAGS